MSLNNQKISVMMIFEVVGRPPEHLTETLNDIIEKINNEEGVNVTERKINEPVLMKNQQDFYTNFAEINLEIKDISLLSALSFKYMPAHIEIVEPENFSIANNEWNGLFNEIMRKLHTYDEVARNIQMEKQILERKLKSLMPEKEE